MSYGAERYAERRFVLRRGAATEGEWDGARGYAPSIKSRGTSYNIYVDWLVPPTYKIIPEPLMLCHIGYSLFRIVKDR